MGKDELNIVKISKNVFNIEIYLNKINLWGFGVSPDDPGPVHVSPVWPGGRRPHAVYSSVVGGAAGLGGGIGGGGTGPVGAPATVV